MPPKSLPEYVKWVMDQDEGLAHVPKAIREQLADDYVSALEDEITAAMLAALPPEKLPLLERMMDHASREEVIEWCEKEVPDLEGITAEVLLRFRNDYVGS